MALSDITRAGVERAIAEFDQIGRAAFLDKYGFDEARSFFVVVDGRQYDSKAIAGAAHGYSRPGEGPLPASEFSGGKATVQRKLESLGFTVVDTSRKRNPDWTRDELILALEAYLKHRPRVPDNNTPEMAKLSAEVRKVAARLGLVGDAKFRNANGVSMKLANFRRLDRTYTESGKVGLPGGSKGEEEIWDEFADRPAVLAAAAATIRAAMDTSDDLTSQTLVDDDEEVAEALEGRLVTRVHRVRERDRKIVASKKSAAVKKFGRLECEACGFDFEKRYGTRGKGFAECHHTKPLSNLVAQTKTHIDDLAIVCANCHRMIHAAAPWLTIEELRSIIVRDPPGTAA